MASMGEEKQGLENMTEEGECLKTTTKQEYRLETEQ